MNLDFKNYLLNRTGASDCTEIEIIQSLWSGYGNIIRYQMMDALSSTVVVKHIVLEPAKEHPRGWNTNYSHNRKLKSYQVETHWYKKWSQVCNDNCRVPKLIGTFSQGQDQWIVLEDLDTHFPIRKDNLNMTELKACLKWLAHFHATFINQKPNGLWDVGTYWHLATRPDELEKIQHPQLKEKAQAIDDRLNRCKYQTIVHGDAKLANFCFSKDGENIAAVDFQYVGGGCGMKDVAYFLGSCLSGSECGMLQDELLDVYFSTLRVALASQNRHVKFRELEDEWREMYPIACTDFTRFLLGWMPSHQKINNYNLNLMHAVLTSL